MVAIGLLILLEHSLWVCLPLVLGLSVNGLVESSWLGLLQLTGVTSLLLVAGAVRRVYVPRLARGVASAAPAGVRAGAAEGGTRAEEAVTGKPTHGVPAWLTSELPEGIRLACGTLGSMLILAQYDVLLLPWCLAWLLPVWLLDTAFRQMDGTAGSELEPWARRPDGTAAGEQQLQVWLQPTGFASVTADAAAARFSLTLLFGLGVLVGALAQYCCAGQCSTVPAAGDVLTVVGSLLLYLVTALQLPGFVQRLRACRSTPLSRRAVARAALQQPH